MPAEGKSYAGIIVNSGENNFTEFLEQQISTPLIKGQSHCCNFIVLKTKVKVSIVHLLNILFTCHDVNFQIVLFLLQK